MEAGTIVKWHKKAGDAIESGDVLMEVATDKATVEYQSLENGWLRKIIVEEGQDATVNQPIAVFSEEQNESIEGYLVAPPAPQTPQTDPKIADSLPLSKEEEVAPKKTSALQQPSFVPEPPLENYAFEYPRGEVPSRILASPLAKKIAKDKGLDLSTIKGTGPNQRVMSRDLEKAQPAGAVAFGHRESPKEMPGSYEEIALTPMRKIIGQRLQESKSFIPHFYVRQQILADALVNVREQLKKGEIRVSINDLIVRACALTLRRHPAINQGFNSVNQTVIQFKTVDIAIAVSIEQGLITPIVRHADFKNVGEISREIKALAQRAKDGKLEAHEYKGGSFTISNLGMFGVSDFQAIINPPQAAILAISAIEEAPVVLNGTIVPGKILNLTLSVDHRVIDGVAAALFLKMLRHYLENPALLLVE
jgi:pyruvate dehydrogenase E2 component (dihydrolipoamide acetyltransferase)